MVKKLILLFIPGYLCLSYSLSAQSITFEEAVEKGKADYLHMLVQYEQQEKDTLLLRELVKVAWKLENTVGYGADTLGMLALHLADSLKLNAFKLEALELMSRIWFRMGYYDDSQKMCIEGLELAKQLGSVGRVSRLMRGQSFAYIYEGAYDSAMYSLIDQIEYLQEYGLSGGNHIQMQLGAFYHLQGEYEAAHFEFDSALSYHHEKNARNFTQRDPTIGRNLILGEKGITYIMQGNLEEGIRLVRLSLGAYVQLDNWRGMAYDFNNLGIGFLKLGVYDSAQYYLEKSIEINTVLQNKNMLAQSFLYMGKLFCALGEAQQAYQWYQDCIEMAKAPAIREVARQGFYDLGQLFVELAHFEQAIVQFHKYDSVSHQVLGESLKRMRSAAEEFLWQKQEAKFAAVASEANLYSRLTWTVIVLSMLAVCTLGLILNRLRLRSVLAEKQQQSLLLEKENAQLAHDKLKGEVDHQRRELASTTMYAMQKNEILRSVQESLQKVVQSHPKAKADLRAVSKFIEGGLQQDRDWENFKVHFEQVHPSFFSSLKKAYPVLSPNDLKHCAYLRINLSVKEVAQMLGINANSVTMSRYRLKKKLGLSPDDSMNDFIQNIS